MKKGISKILMSLLVLAFSFGAFAGCTPREEILKIYNWGEYMSPDVYKGFETWYEEKTQEKIKVVYKEFDTNENMETAISVKKADYDLVCPSDYMIEKMRKANLLEELDTTIIDVKQEGLFYEGLIDLVKDGVDPELKYTVPYVWGTFGIMYDSSKVTDKQDMNSWQALWSEKYKGAILMKDSVRDAYSAAQIYANRALLSEKSVGFTNYNEEYKKTLDSIFNDVSVETIEAAKQALSSQKPLLKDYEVDDGKDDMLTGNGPVKLGLFWSCDAGYVMNDVVTPATGCSKETVTPGNKNLFYVVPEEGSNVWLDGFVIPKTAGNKKAANYFLKYLCETDVAKENMDWLGTSVAVNSAMELAKEELEADEEFFKDTKEGFREMYMDMIFPSEETLSRCAIMKDFGEFNLSLIEMWEYVRGK